MTLLDRIRAKLALALDRGRADGECPSPEDIVAWQEKALTPREAQHVQAHVARCGDCAALWTGLLSVTMSDEAPQEAQAPKRRAFWRGWFLGVPALALGILGVTLLPSLMNPGPTLPGYTLSAQGGMTARGGDDQPIVLSDGSALEIVLSPDVASDLVVYTEVFAERDGRIEPWPAPVEGTDKGVIVVDVVIGVDVDIPRGAQRLWVVTSLPGVSVDPLVLRAADGQPVSRPGWRAWPIPVQTPR
ncbi:MAG: zf-HC2 domain-containing protein [Pseudomonadota bacterium]